MSVLLLPNTIGDAATSLVVQTYGATATGYDINNLISGPRSTMWRSDAETAGDNIRPFYHLPSDQTPTHYVITRADLLLTQGTMRLEAVEKNSGGTYGMISGVLYNPLTSADLMGPTFQDLCFPVTPSKFRGFGLNAISQGSSDEAMQISKMFVSTAFDFGTEPSQTPPPGWDVMPMTQAVQLFIPQHGYQPFEVERRITLYWIAITRQKAQAFKGIPQLMKWPMYLYDESGDIFTWRLEHVIVENYQEEIVAEDTHNIAVSFLRLRHYE